MRSAVFFLCISHCESVYIIGSRSIQSADRKLLFEGVFVVVFGIWYYDRFGQLVILSFEISWIIWMTIPKKSYIYSKINTSIQTLRSYQLFGSSVLLIHTKSASSEWHPLWDDVMIVLWQKPKDKISCHTPPPPPLFWCCNSIVS